MATTSKAKIIEYEPPNIVFTDIQNQLDIQSYEAERIALIHRIAVRTLGGESYARQRAV